MPPERLFPRYLKLISIPVWLAAWQDEGNGSIYKPKLVSDVEQNRYIVGFALRGLRRRLKRVDPLEASFRRTDDASRGYWLAQLASLARKRQRE